MKPELRTHPGDLTAQESPVPGNLPSKARKNANARGGGVLGAAGIDWLSYFVFFVISRCVEEYFGIFN